MQLLKLTEEGIIHAQRLGNGFPWAQEEGTSQSQRSSHTMSARLARTTDLAKVRLHIVSRTCVDTIATLAPDVYLLKSNNVSI